MRDGKIGDTCRDGHKESALGVVDQIRRFLNSGKTQEKYRVKRKDFSRQRILTFPRVSMLVLRGHKVSAQNGLNGFFAELNAMQETPTGSAYCQARRKVMWELFVELNELAVESFYEQETAAQGIRTWHGRRLLAVDGSLLNLPNTKELREVFSVQRNQHTDFVQAQMMVIHDVLHDLGLAATLQPIQSEPASLVDDRLWQATKTGDVLVMDRGFVGYALFATAAKTARDLIVRCGNVGFDVVKAFFHSDQTDVCTQIELPAVNNAIQHVKQHGLPKTVAVRLVKGFLPEGKPIVLMTTLCDSVAFPATEILAAYNLRYAGIEGYFDRLKNTFDLERFSGFTEQTIRQDFHGMIFLTSLESILTKPAQHSLDSKSSEQTNPSRPKVNHTTTYALLIHHVLALLADTNIEPELILHRITQLLVKTPTYHAPGRSFPRQRRKYPRTVNFLRYRKRLTG